MDKSKKIAEWLDSHVLFSISGMCSQVGINASNFSKQKAMGKIPKVHQPKIEAILKDYGYKN